MHAWLLMLALAASQATGPIQIPGVVHDSTGLALAGAVIEIDGTLVAVSDDTGAFDIQIAAGTRTTVRVVVPGFEPFEVILEGRPGVRLDVVLPLGRFEDRVVVSTPAKPPADQPTFEIE